MQSSIAPMHSLRALAFRPHRGAHQWQTTAAIGVKRPASRTFADKSKDLPTAADPGTGKEALGPNMQQQEHVSEEAAKMANITGGQGPDIEGQGTPAQEILKDDKEAQKQAPQVMKDSIKFNITPPKPSTRTFSTLARRQMELTPQGDSQPHFDMPPSAPSHPLTSTYDRGTSLTTLNYQGPGSGPGHKFPLPELPLPSNMGKDYRYNPLVKQVTNLLMRDGKLSVAQRNMATILTTLRTAPAPTYSTTKPLLPGAPPASYLPLNPTLYLTLAIDSIAPLLRIRSQRGAAGGGVALQIPVPLGLRQRRRQSIMWILDAASKRPSRGSGNDQFAQRVAEEIIAAVEGRSGIWDRRGAVHKLATTARSNLNFGRTGFRR